VCAYGDVQTLPIGYADIRNTKAVGACAPARQFNECTRDPRVPISVYDGHDKGRRTLPDRPTGGMRQWATLAVDRAVRVRHGRVIAAAGSGQTGQD
jgi:hypothetical protein